MVNFWSSLNADQKRAFRAKAHERVFAAGARLMQEGDHGDHVAVILSGVTEIRVDEYDTERAPVEWLAPGTARVTARLPVTELEELFGVTVDAEDVETVGGLLAHELGRVPIAGADATVAGLRLTAENLAGRRNKLGTVLVQRVDAESELS